MIVEMMIGIVIIAYISTSFVLLKYPQLIYKRKRNVALLCRHISHRGGAAEILENSIPSFQNAVNQGTDMLELDCQLSSDGEVIVAHDDSLYRLCGRQINISQIPYSEIPLTKPELALDFDTDVGTKCIPSLNDEDRKIPLLRSVFEKFPETAINIDLKSTDPQLVHKVSDLVEEFGRTSNTVWGNFRNSVCRTCYAVLIGLDKIEADRKIDIIGFTRKAIIWDQCGLHTWMNIGTLIAENCCFAQYAIPEVFQLLRAVCERTVYVWVLNSPEQWQKAFELGATGVMTDYPTDLADFLRNNPDLPENFDS